MRSSPRPDGPSPLVAPSLACALLRTLRSSLSEPASTPAGAAKPAPVPRPRSAARKPAAGKPGAQVSAKACSAPPNYSRRPLPLRARLSVHAGRCSGGPQRHAMLVKKAPSRALAPFPQEQEEKEAREAMADLDRFDAAHGLAPQPDDD